MGDTGVRNRRRQARAPALAVLAANPQFRWTQFPDSLTLSRGARATTRGPFAFFFFLPFHLDQAAYGANNFVDDERNTVQHIAVNLAYAEPCPDQ
jgi:hypothetical protein